MDLTEHRRAEAWYTCVRQARPFREVRRLPPELKVPRWFIALLGVVVAAGIVTGLVTEGEARLPLRIASAGLWASLYVYVSVSALDVWEHFRLEKHVSGSYFSATVVPIGESIVHGALGLTLVAFIGLAGPFRDVFGLRDWFVLVAPLLFLALGWCDELIFHRRRALHREDMLHTVSHLAAGTMIASLFASRIVEWTHVGG